MQTMFKVIVAGGRDFQDYELLRKHLDFLLQFKTNIQIISGGARGADKLGERYARERNLNLKVFEADWNKYGKAAGHIRNRQMAEYANACICFWDGKSAGTKNMIELAHQYKLHIRIKNY